MYACQSTVPLIAKISLAKDVPFSAVINHADRIPAGIKVHLIGALIFSPGPDASKPGHWEAALRNVNARQEADGSRQRTSEISREASGLRLFRQDQRSGACIFFCSCSTTSSAEERRRLQEQVYADVAPARQRLCLSSPRERRVLRRGSVLSYAYMYVRTYVRVCAPFFYRVRRAYQSRGGGGWCKIM
jgi:hypothetical protein